MEFVPNEFVEHAIENLSVLKSPVKPFGELAGRHWTNYAKAFSSKVFLYKVEFHRGPRNRRNQWDVNIKKRTNKKWRRIELRELLRTPRKFIQFYIVTLEEGTEELPLSYRHSYEKVTRIIDLLALQKRCYQFVVDIDDVLVTEEVLAKIHKRTFFKELSVSAEEIQAALFIPYF
ncbi:hypothetical protein L596_018287 [Steinernema carpocapsae]|uniref:Uncharacterized protein n=1 Tax=Steinernema carpocapsae TaxID=34508 RepID=A0A4U5N4H8_STECR|nr:hypothetical protein L596_018287 [Steinernema carpocapsae]